MPRILITILAVALAAIFAVAVFMNSARRSDRVASDADVNSATSATTIDTGTATTSSEDAAPARTGNDEEASGDIHSAAAQTTTNPAHAASDTAIGPLRAVPATVSQPSVIGSLEPNSPYRMQVELAGWGASIHRVHLADFAENVGADERYMVEAAARVRVNGSEWWVYPFAARTIQVNGQWVELASLRWHLSEPGVYWIELVNADEQPVVRITRRYTIDMGSTAYQIRCDQDIENLTDAPLTIVWEQNAQTDLPQDISYLSDQRLVVAGYHDLEYDPQRLNVYTEHTLQTRTELLKQRQEMPSAKGAEPWWPNPKLPAKRELLWVSTLNRYFATSVYRTLPPITSEPKPDHAPALDDQFELGLQVVGQTGVDVEPQLIFTLTSKPTVVAPGGRATFDLSLFTGPRQEPLFAQYPFDVLRFSRLIIYSLPGFCSVCTFQWLADGLLAFLRMLHALTQDWGVAIIILVLVVRLVLHPLTKKSQVSMMKMGKQMQTLQPELEKLKKKYKDDQKLLQQETMKLYREKGVNPANMLGCLPMLLQMPIWFALYAMLYFTIELRHQPAFYGVFQAISGGSWQFLADLSSPDRFITFSDTPKMVHLLLITFDYSSLNILPILMAVVFYFQQKMTTPPPANEQAAQQQKMMKWMTLLFPLLMYSMPCGLTLYILASTAGGIVDSYFVRKHVREMEQSGQLFERKARGGSGFMDRMRAAIEQRSQDMAKRQGGGSRRPRKSR